MRATVMPKAHEVRIENIPDAAIQDPTDAVIRVTRACICGSDLWPYNDGPNVDGQRMGHEAIGVVEDVGSDVQTIKRGQVVIMPFANSDGSCTFCNEGLQTACVHVGFFGNGGGLDGAQAEALRIPYADGTLYPLSVGEDDALMPSLLTLSDVMGTGHHAAVAAQVKAGHGSRSLAMAPSASAASSRRGTWRRADHHHGPPQGTNRTCQGVRRDRRRLRAWG
jgi:threonine dehydrogenase-like Zn-dependent dehydrogenase